MSCSSIFASNRLKEHVSLWTFVAFFTISHVESQSTKITSTTCSSSQLLCGGGICYDPTIQYCTELGTIVQCAGICGNQCYNPNTQQCFNGTVCSLNEQLCIVEYDSSNGYTYNSPYYWCYDPLYEVSFNNSLCQHPYRSCNERCLRYNEVCVNNVTVCNVTSVYHNYELEQIQLCNGICFDSAVQQCVDEQVVLCIRDPFTQKCIDRSISYSQFLNTTTLSTSTISTTTKSSVLFRCCSVKQCTINADCCIRDTEWQCFRHSNQDYGSCLNPYIEPICAEGCPIQKQCRNDTDCCKCQCAQITVININGTLVTKKQCLPR